MASWTDNPQIAFNPYVQQVPTEALVSVGTELQRRYDEGVQKIQSSIDRVAGLDIARDVDKKYLQSKLNDLGTRLRTVAAGDFSNYQLTNHVAGMASSVGKDENIITAVKSTAWYRKQAEQMEKDNASGKGNPANNARFNNRANAWFSSTELGKSFNDSYIPPVDVWGKIKDIADKVGVNSSDIMELFETDAQGNYVMEKDKDGTERPKFNPIAAQKVLKGKDPASILSAFESSLTSADFQQLAIEGEYQLASHTPEMLRDNLTNSSIEQTSLIKDKTDKLRNELYKENHKDKPNPERISSLEGQIEYFDKQAKRIQTSLETSLSIVDTNPDAVRGAIFTNKYLSSMANNLSSQEESITYSVSPWHTIAKDQRDFEFNQQKENRRIAEWNANYTQDERKMEQDWKIALLKEGGQEGIPTSYPKAPISEDDAIRTKSSILKRGEDLAANRDNLASAITIERTKRLNDGVTNDRDIAKIIETEAEKKGMTIADYKNYIASEEISNPNTLFTDKSILKRYKEAVETTQYFQNRITSISKDADEIARQRGLNVPNDEELKRQLGRTTVQIRRGLFDSPRDMNLSSEDVLDFIYTEPALLKRISGDIYLDFPNKEERERKTKAEEKLKKKFGEDYEVIKSKLIPTQLGSPITGRLHPNIEAVVGNLNSKDFKERSKIEAELFIQEGMLQQPVFVPILEGKEKNADMISRIAAVALSSGIKLSDKDIQEALHSKEDKSVGIYVKPKPDGTTDFELTVIKADGDRVSIPIDAEKYINIKGEAPPQNTLEPMVINMLRNYGTTNVSGKKNGSDKENATTAHFDEDDFTKFKSDKYRIKGDLVTETGNPREAWMVLYLFDKDGNYVRSAHYPKDDDGYARIKLYTPDGGYNMVVNDVAGAIDYNIVNELMKLE